MTPNYPPRPSQLSFRVILLSLAIFTATGVIAQVDRKSDKLFNYEAGLSFYHPLKYFNMFSSIGTGVDVAALHPLVNGLSVGARINYGYFLGRTADQSFTSGNGDHYKASSLYNFFGEANYKLPSNIIVGLDLGYGVVSFNGASDGSFARKIYLGYELDGWNFPLILAAFYEQTDYHKNAGIRATLKF